MALKNLIANIRERIKGKHPPGGIGWIIGVGEVSYVIHSLLQGYRIFFSARSTSFHIDSLQFQGKVDAFSFVDCSSSFCFLLI